MILTKFPVAVISTFLWIGFVCAISFLEAWLKFRAPGVTLPLGLGIGRLVFGALNKIEWVFAIAIIVNLLFVKGNNLTPGSILYFIPLVLLAIQSFWLLPVLDTRAETYLSGEIPPASNLHFYYVGMEFIKVGCLLAFGIGLFKKVTL
ncbi:hypothetical protein G3O08_03675 [Cryomorpha ignava]|uniref:DUF4149 domain-containing protein n=1 Tax=Cryomorpha ignava TaxID=101383 RepID=A0A7K3WLS9_9FLAO|nr:hypothetical protein [Cryomorpha ignava]NEN22603.1 hypothetical protein [Cryomorpha ignava]